MKICWQFLYKTVVIEYYKQNALFFLAIVLVAFGFLSGAEHIAFAKNIAVSILFLFYVYLLWSLYVYKVLVFFKQMLNSPQFIVLYKLQLINIWKQALLWASIVYLLLLPIIAYGYFIVIVSYKLTIYITLLYILVFQLFAITAVVFFVIIRIVKPPEREFFIGRINILPKVDFITPFSLYFFRYLLSKHAIPFMVIKLISLLIISFFVWLYPTDDYDMRLFGLMAIIIGAVNLRLMQLYLNFDDLFLSFHKNLPLSSFQIIGHSLLVLFSVSFPELFAFVLNAPFEVSFIQVLLTHSLYFTFLLIATNVFTKYGVGSDRSIQILFFVMVVFSLLIMANVPFIILTFIFIVYLSVNKLTLSFLEIFRKR